MVGVLPGLDPDTVHRVGDGAVLHVQVGDILLVAILAETPNANAVARAAVDIGDANVGVGCSDRDAIVSGTDVGMRDGYVGRETDVDAVCVGAVLWCGDGDVVDVDVVAFVDHEVEHLAVQ